MTFDRTAWNETILQLPEAHLLQTWQWAQVRQAYGWQPIQRAWCDDKGQVKLAASILQRTLSPIPVRILYAPRGPVVDWADPTWRTRALAELEAVARQQHAIFIKIDPEARLGTGVPGREDAQDDPAGQALQAELKQRGWQFSTEQVQFRNTVMVDLTEPEEDWMARLKQKARYNLRLGEKRGVQIRTGTEGDLDLLYHMYAETSVRDGFLIRAQSYYDRLWKTFLQQEMLEPLIAEVEGQPVAAIMVFYFGKRAWYLQGMSRDFHREKMPNYLLQWSAIRHARQRGCEWYDLWGAPNRFDETDSLWGVFRFKEAIGGLTVRTIGAWDYPVQPVFYAFYTRLLPRILSIMRRRGRARTRQEVIG